MLTRLYTHTPSGRTREKMKWGPRQTGDLGKKDTFIMKDFQKW